jgi:hypothetical protein
MTSPIVVVVGEDAPWLDAGVEAAHGKPLQRHHCILVVWVLEVSKEVLWTVPGDLDVSLLDSKAVTKHLLYLL